MKETSKYLQILFKKNTGTCLLLKSWGCQIIQAAVSTSQFGSEEQKEILNVKADPAVKHVL